MSADPGVLGPPAELQQLRPVSPSHFIGLQACALREVWAASRIPPLLPVTPAARLGTVAHRLLEEAGRGQFEGAAPGAIERRWDGLLEAAEDSASQSWLDRHLVPLRAAVPDYEVRRLQALSAARAIAAEACSIPHRGDAHDHAPLGCEVPVSTPDGQAGGRVDAVAPSGDGPILKDYKSGTIYDREGAARGAIKPEYAAQLKLCAAIYAAMTGTWPSRLEVVPIAGLPESVPFTREECMGLLNEAIGLRDRINGVIASGGALATQIEQLATPAPRACTHCGYRPQCAAYLEARGRDPGVRWPLDVRGQLIERRMLGNGRLLLGLDSGGTTVYIRGIDPSPERHPALMRMAAGDTVASFNLRPVGSPTSFAEGSFTVFYVVPAGVDRDRTA